PVLQPQDRRRGGVAPPPVAGFSEVAMADITMDHMVQKAQAMLKLANEAANETDPEKARENAEKLLAMGRELERMGEEMKAQYRVKNKIARVEVVLTPDQ